LTREVGSLKSTTMKRKEKKYHVRGITKGGLERMKLDNRTSAKEAIGGPGNLGTIEGKIVNRKEGRGT